MTKEQRAQMNAIPLNPCPYCKMAVRMSWDHRYVYPFDISKSEFWVTCSNCWARGPLVLGNPQGAADKWNACKGLE